MSAFLTASSSVIYEQLAAQTPMAGPRGIGVPATFNSTHRYTFNLPVLAGVLKAEARWQMPMINVLRNGALRPLQVRLRLHPIPQSYSYVNIVMVVNIVTTRAAVAAGMPTPSPLRVPRACSYVNVVTMHIALRILTSTIPPPPPPIVYGGRDGSHGRQVHGDRD